MSGYILRDQETAVSLPAQRIDKLLARGDGDAALLYLFLLRTDRGVTPQEVAGRLRWTAERFDGAERTLRQLGLLEGGGGSAAPAEERPTYTTGDLTDMLEGDGVFAALVRQIEEKLGKKLKTADLQILAGLYDDVALPPDVIYLLVNHCIDRAERRFGPGRRPTMRQVEKEGYLWAEMGLFDQERAARYLKEQSRRSSRMGAYLRALQISGRQPVESEERYLNDWMSRGFSPELVALAYDQTIFYKKEMNWRYLNAVLRRWEENGWLTPEQAQQGMSAAAAQRTGKKTEGAGKNDWMRKYIGTKG